MMRGGDRVKAITYNAWNPRHLGLVIVITALINGLLFASLPWLTHVVDSGPDTGITPPYVIIPPKIRKTPQPQEKNRRIEKPIDSLLKPSIKPETRQKNVPDIGFVMTKSNEGVPVIIIDPEETVPEMKEFIFDPSQLDKAPRVIRKVPPIYPFDANKQGLTGWVLIRCLVDKDGLATRINAVESDPPDALDTFGPSAVDAVKKWRFRPGEIGGDPVPTRVVFRVVFEID
jgi:protein TonB